MTDSQAPSDALNDAPGALIRTMDGHITFWSSGMERRYWFAAREALGQVSHQLLRTASWQALGEIEAELVDRKAWDGGLIHHRADGQPVMAANHWHLHHEAGGRGDLVTELHADIVQEGVSTGGQLADVLATIAQELSQPLAALGGYIGGTQRALQRPWPDRARLDQGITEAITQLARAGEVLRRVRALGENLRNPPLAKSERIVETACQVARESLAESVPARQAREQAREALHGSEGTGEASIERAAVARNIQLFRRLLRQETCGGLDAQTGQALRQLLAEEEVKLGTLERPEAAPG